MITPYALMMDDPTTEAMICWIDERPGADDTPQTLRYGPSDVEIMSTVNALPGGSTYIHFAHITDLEPGSLCDLMLVDVDGGVSFPPVKILPSRVPRSGIVGLSISDTHCERRQISSPGSFGFIGAERPDFVIMAGDSSGQQNQDATESNAALHVRTFRNYFTQWWADGDFLPQMLCDAGNHWVRNNSSDGVSLGDAIIEEGLYDWFHPNAKAIQPEGVRHLVASAGNWLQVISGDVYSNTVDSSRTVFLQSHDETKGLCIFMTHSPFFSRGDRFSNDNVLQKNLRDALFYEVSSRENCHFTFGGNMHLDAVTKPLAWRDSSPGDIAIPVDGERPGYIAPAEDGSWKTMVEFGEGCIGGRAFQEDPLVPEEFWSRLERFPLNYYIMRFRPGRVVVENKTEEGLVSEHEFSIPLYEGAGGNLTRVYSSSGAPVSSRESPLLRNT